ncbi:hypothetical protein acsn021_08670 [Anaerocolumna cellulosilytica]|uniref:Uncharacterized protein n=1 Tax=Anaerocolumna cellulosilytica TaxID=433286 RepID=A0A6S6R2P0_9FIRM|nr:hemerythrin domain-containing protein [Anaerocolumna cellulosilytica]MBB5194355.1 hemerythrin-like metal-binding protein [Anaerocolumna cellulosilytica]BCJ93298.1 hypothetical protein acsn021_08670 [Anaerocolumna cellulosilytica]
MINWNFLFLVDNDFDYKLRKLIETILENVFLLNADTCHNMCEILIGLREFIENHLEYEEKIMNTVDYPTRDEHIEKHNELRKELFQIHSETDNSIEVVNDRLSYVIEWLSLHIVDSDNLLSKYLNNHKINPDKLKIS